MKTVFQTLAFVALGAVVFSTTGCKLTCSESEEEKGGQCIAKSLTKFEGTASSQSSPFTTGQTVAVKGLFGHIKVVQGSTAGEVKVNFQPFDYQGYDEKDLATSQMNDNLSVSLTTDADNNIVAQVQRVGSSSTGLGCDVTLEVPSDFDGRLVLDNLGAGTFASHGEFDVTAEYVGSATSVSIKADAGVSNCTLKGSPTVRKTDVTCGDVVTVTNVSDDVNITSKSSGNFDDPSVILSVASISDSATGGKITVSEGGIQATFPATGNYAVQASAPKGNVDMGTAPSGCGVQEAASTAKTLTCGSGAAVYQLSTDGENGSVFTEGNITLAYK